MRLNPEHLLTFAAVVREGGVAAAARRLHLTQPAVSNQLRNLQQVIGDALYRRQGRGIALTGAGQRLYPEAQRLADALSAAENLATSLGSGESGLVRVAASQTLGAYVLPSVLAAFREQAPRVEIELESHNTRRVLERLEACDIGLVEGNLDRPLPPDWQFETLATDEIVALLRRDHPLAASRSLSLDRLAAQPQIWRESGSGTREQVEQAFRVRGLVPQVRIALAGVAAIKEAVREGLGVGFVSRLALQHDSALLVGVPLRPRLPRTLGLVMPRDPAPSTLRFLGFLRARMSEHRHPED